MNYLCAHHRAQVARSVSLAQKLWVGANSEGQQAFTHGDWHRARSFFGSAWDIVRVRTDDLTCCTLSGFDTRRLVHTADYLARTLCELGHWTEAQQVALAAYHSLDGAALKTQLRTHECARQHQQLAGRVQNLLATVFGGDFRCETADAEMSALKGAGLH